MVGYNMDGPSRDKIMALIEEKERIENEILNEQTILAENHFGPEDTLVDDESFPRNDIDVYQVSHARHRLVCLQNDHKNIMKQIEKGLIELHAHFLPNRANASSSNSNSSGEAAANGQPNQAGGSSEPDSFAVVGCVQHGSPADLGGLCEHDKIIQFGSVKSSNFIDVTQLHNIVTHSICQPILVKVKRGQNIINVFVVPRPWAQPGLLGCQIKKQSSLPDT